MIMDVPYDDDTRARLWRIDVFAPDGGARDDIALVVYDNLEDVALARQIFSADELDNSPVAGTGVSDWLNSVFHDLLNSDGRNTCDDCGNRFDADRPHGGHAADCDYAVD